MFWVKISQVTAKGDLQKFSPLIIFVVTAFGTAVITSFLITTFIFSTLLRLPRKSILPLTVLSSARHSSIAVAVIDNLPPNVGDKDLMFFPIIFVYLSMIVIISCFGAFMKIEEKELNDIAVESAEKPTMFNRNPHEEFTSYEMVQRNDSITLPMIQWSTAV